MSSRLVSLRTVAATAATALLLALAPLAGPAPQAFAGPVADSDDAYLLCGRVFPDPQAYWVPELGESTPHPGTGTSPFAKGNAPCAARTFITYDEAIRGVRYLADSLETTRDFVELIDLSDPETDPRYRRVLDEELGDGYSQGIPNELGEIERQPLYLVKVTAPDDWDPDPADGLTPIPEEQRDHFAWSLSIHGIERAGAEGGIRAIEDLATWAGTDPDRLLLETYDDAEIPTQGGNAARNLTIGEVMMRSVSYFLLPNPDGWRSGDPDQGNTSFFRYNGRGMDLNRDWPEIGWTSANFTPWSESETRTYGRVLQDLSDNWTGGIDLHGMVVANAFSYTLIGAAQRPFDKNQRVMQFVQEAWADAETRLSWSPMIKPNDEPNQCLPFDGVTPTMEINQPPDCDQRVYGVQYGTIWDTINYTVTGAFGTWMDSPLGLNADGINNEMMLSHLGNCGTGTCYLPDFEQLHVDGNKSLVYAMLNFSLQPPPAVFEVGGDVGYLVNPRRLVDPGVAAPQPPEGAVAADDVSGVVDYDGRATAGNPHVLHEFTVDNEAGETFIQGISGEARFQVIGGESVGAANSIRVQYRDPVTGDWTTRASSGSDVAYRTPGEHSDWNYPRDGEYRFVLYGPVPDRTVWNLKLHTEPVWNQPLQQAFDVSNMDFFSELEPFLGGNTTLTALDVDAVLAGDRNLSDFDSLIVVDDALLPGYHEGTNPGRGLQDLPATGYTAEDAATMGQRLRAFAEGGGNLVLTDNALRAVEWMGVVPPGSVGQRNVYASNATFTTDHGYDHPLVEGLNQPGMATGRQNRKQMAEPVPLGYPLSMPQHFLQTAAVTEAGGTLVGGTLGNNGQAALAEIPLGDGVIRTFGGVLPFPTTATYHPFGLASYSVTDNGYTVMRNMLTWDNPNQSADPNLTDDPISWIASDIPTRIFVDGTALTPASYGLGTIG